ncbi:MAG TPA: DUF6703 family protein [Actinomycetes bacterium]|nr:DUF6703 family protein [Actinomycetes bacterium]
MPNDRRPTALERFSGPLLLKLSRVPRWMLLVAVLALTVAGLLLENVLGGVLLLLLAAFLAWLAVLGWPSLAPVGRLLRLLVIGLVVYVAFTKLI